MFELSDELEIKIATNIGPQKRSAVVIDNFYKNPDEIRNLCLESHRSSNKELCSGLPGTRVFLDLPEVKDNLTELLLDLCFDTNIWVKQPEIQSFLHKLSKMRFLCNVIDDESLLKRPFGIIPHQDYYSNAPTDMHLNNQFGAVIYLNTPEECAGGTSLYSLNGEMTVPRLDNPYIPPHPDGLTEKDMSPREVFNYIKNSMDNDGHWKVEHTFEMVYNRFVLYEAKNLHGQCVDLGMFTDYSRINQVIFL